MLAMDAAGLTCSVALLDDARCLIERSGGNSRAAAASLPRIAEGILAEFGEQLGAVAVTIGPGSFTGLRGALALAHGLALGRGVPVVGVTVAEALLHGGRPAWVALDARRPGRIFLDTGGGMAACLLDALPPMSSPTFVVGDAAEAVCAARPAAIAGGISSVSSCAVGQVALRRLAGEIGPCSAWPLYIEAPAARECPGVNSLA